MMQVIEAMVIGVIVLGAIAFAVTFNAPPPPSASTSSEDMREVTWDAIDSVNQLHYPSEGYANSTLSKAIAEAAAGNPERLVETLGSFLPAGSQYNVYLNNGYDRLALYESRNHTGETVGTAYPVQPNWRYHYGAPDLTVHDANTTSNSLGLTLVPIFNANHVRDEGVRLKATFEGDQDWVPGQGVTEWATVPGGPNPDVPSTTVEFSEHAYATLVQGNATVAYPSASIYMECERSDGTIEPCYALDASDNPLQGYSPPENGSYQTQKGKVAGWYNVSFIVHNDGPANVPAGTRLSIDLPVGLRAHTIGTTDFDNTKTSRDHLDGPTTVTGKLASTLAADDSAEFTVNLSTVDDRYAFKQVTATLSDGAVSKSNLLLRVEDKEQGVYTGGDTRITLISGPTPAGSGADPVGRWGIVLAFPYGSGDVNWMNLTQPLGDTVIDSVSWPADFNPEFPSWDDGVRAGSISVVDGKTVQWKKNEHRIPGYTFVELQLEIGTDGTFTEASPKIPPARPQAEFTGYVPPAHAIQIEPGIWWRDQPPHKDDMVGYGMSSTGESIQPRTVENTIDYRNAELTGQSNYTLATFGVQDQKTGGFKDALHAAKLYPHQQRIPIGESVHVSLESRDFASFLAEEVGLNTMSLETKIYAPWGIRDRIPVATYEHAAASAPTAHGLDLQTANVNGDGAADVIVAATDGNVYSLDGKSGTKIAGVAFNLPESSDPTSPAQPTMLSRTQIPGIGAMYAVGTSNGVDDIYNLDHNLDERWSAQKPEELTTTLGINTSISLPHTNPDYDDSFPEVIASFKAEDVAVANAHGNSRLVLLAGRDNGIGQGMEGDGLGDVYPGWEWNIDGDPGTGDDDNYGVVLNGSSTQLGLGFVGSHGRPGVFANTGAAVGTSDLYTAKSTLSSLQSGDIEQTFEDANEFSLSVQGSGLKGFYDDARNAWNYTGGRFVRAMASDAIPTGGNWSGIAAGGYDGWVYGFNASKAIYPVDGWELIGATQWNDIAMANGLEGYSAETDGRLYSTRSGWTDMYNHRKNIGGLPNPSTRVHPGVQAVDTPEAPYLDDASRVSWWAGDAGMILRSTDRLRTVDTMTTTGALEAVIHGDISQIDVLVQNLGNLDLTLINWEAVHAVDEQEAWFVGGGVPGTSEAPYGFIGHTTDGGDSISVTRLGCTYASNSTLLDQCHLNDIGFDGQRLWVVGDYGTVLVLDVTGQAFDTRVQDARMIGNGSVELDIDTSGAVEIDDVRVDWAQTGKLDWTKSVQLDTGTSNGTLWAREGGDSYINDPLTNYHADYGAARNALLDADGYATDVSGAANSFSGPATLTVGPFRTTLAPSDPNPLDDVIPFFNKADYTDDEIGEMDFPLNYTVNVTYTDGTRDIYRIGFNETGAVTLTETTELNWKTPADIGFDAPNACFGKPYEKCKSLRGINVTDLDGNIANNPTGLIGGVVGDPNGENASEDVRGQPWLFRIEDASVDKIWQKGLNQTYRDLAVNMADPDKWVLVGDTGRVITSYDRGWTWTEVPSPATSEGDPSYNLYTVDWSHSDVAYIGGGGKTGLQLTMNGYTEWGRITTDPLPLVDGGSLSTSIDRIDIDDSRFTISEVTTGEARVNIHVWDPGLNGAQGGWGQIYSSTDGWTDPYTFSQATSEVKLRVELTTPKHNGFSRFSPQVRGELQLIGSEGAQVGSGQTVTFDTNDTSLVASGMDSVDYQVINGHGVYRLAPAHNPWVHKLGNFEEGDWANANAHDRGARVADMDLNEDETVLYVGTEGIYQWGVSDDAPPVAVHNVTGEVNASDPEGAVENGDFHLAYDNTLYAIDMATGERNASWDPVHFDAPIQHVEVAKDAVFVVTNDRDDLTMRPTLWRVAKSDQSLTSHDRSLSDEEDVVAVAVGKVWGVGGTEGDLFISLLNTATTEGVVQAHASPTLNPPWSAKPNLKGTYQFSYDVPRSAMYGAYLMVTTFQWDTVNDPNTQLLQTARIHNSFTVTPPTGEVPVAPTYNLEVVSWLEDWG